MLVPIAIYRQNVEFYSPTKLDINTDPLIQNLAIVLWESEVYFNGKEPVKIKYQLHASFLMSVSLDERKRTINKYLLFTIPVNDCIFPFKNTVVE